jgi:hypothetical protein
VVAAAIMIAAIATAGPAKGRLREKFMLRAERLVLVVMVSLLITDAPTLRP